ncbi:MAG: hypothetical protein LBN25_02240, partial [Christensenellaceae bacterium]|nr:hypothetical protein [Christensenellaceae bacterium]
MKFTSRKRISFVLTAAIFAAFTALFALLGITTRTIAKNEGGGVAGAAEDYTPYLTFSVSPDTYLSGTPVAYYPKITVTLTADANVISNYLSNISLLYLEVSSENGMYTPEQFRAVDPAAFSSAGRGLDLWVLPSGGGKAFCEIDTAEISGNTASYKSYIYFKTQYLDGTAVVGEEFQSGGYIEFGVYTHTEQNYAITGITTYYTSPDVPLTLYNDNDVWIGSEAVFTVETANNDLPVNVFFAITHELDQYGNEILDDAHLVWHNSNGGVYRPGLPARTAERTIILNGDVLRAITSEIAQSVAGGAGQNSEDGYGYGAFDGTIHFKVMDKPQMFSQLGSPMIIKIDTAEPEFTVSAFKTDAVNNVTNQMYDLEAKGWSDSHIQVKLIPGAVDANIPQFYRGAPLKYFFSASNDTQGDAIYTAFETGTDEYVKLITETTLSFSFKAESLTGRYRTSETYSVNIDTVNPSVSLTSTDKIGHIVLSALIPATSSNQISGYASQFLSVIASNGVQNTAPLSFYYTVDGGAPIALQKTIGASNLWNSVPVQFLPDISNPRKDFVFTIESATGLKSSALLRVTVIPDAVYKNMPGNRDFNAEIKYENPPPQITGWSADMLTLFVSVESFLTSNEYLGYSIDAGGEYDLTVLSGTQVLDRTVTYLNMTTVPDTEIKIKHYSIQIKDSINNAHISLKVTNRAGASYTVVNTPEAYRVDLQLEIAGYNAVTVTKRIGTGAIVLGPDDWSKGRVNIELVPAFHTGYSGIRVYYALPDPADSTHTQFVKG